MRINFSINIVLVFVLIISTIALFGPKAPPPHGTRPIDDFTYDFLEITDECSLYQNIDLENSSVCPVGRRSVFTYWNNETNWNIMCCSFTSECFEETYEDCDDICEEYTAESMVGPTFYQSGKWVAYCCNEEGTFCYVDTDVDPDDPGSVCNQEYMLNTFSLKYDGIWDAVCCRGRGG